MSTIGGSCDKNPLLWFLAKFCWKFFFSKFWKIKFFFVKSKISKKKFFIKTLRGTTEASICRMELLRTPIERILSILLRFQTQKHARGIRNHVTHQYDGTKWVKSSFCEDLMSKSTTAENSDGFADLVKVLPNFTSFNFWTTNTIKFSQKKFYLHTTVINVSLKKKRVVLLL